MFDPNLFYDSFGMKDAAREPPHLFEMEGMGSLWLETEDDGRARALHFTPNAGALTDAALMEILSGLSELPPVPDLFLSRSAARRLWIHILSSARRDESREALASLERLVALLRASSLALR